MKRVLLTGFTILLLKLSFPQQAYIDSLKNELNGESNDTMRMLLYAYLDEAYAELNPDSSLMYAEKELVIAKKFNLKLEEVHALVEMGYAQMNKGNYPRSLQNFLSAIATAEDRNSEKNVLPPRFPSTDEFSDRNQKPSLQRLEKLGRTHQYTGILYGNANNYEKAKSHYFKAEEIARTISNTRLLAIINLTLGRTYYTLKDTDSALIILQKAYDNASQSGYKRYLGSILLNLGRVYVVKGNYQLANQYFRQAVISSSEQYYYRGVIAGNLALADLHKQQGKKDSVLLYIKEALPVAQFLNAPDLLLRIYKALADYYKAGNVNDSTVKYQSLIIKINDSLFNSKQAQEFQNIDFDERQKQQQIESKSRVPQ